MDLLITIFSWIFSITVGVILAQHILGPLLVWKQQGLTGRYAMEKLPGAEFLAWSSVHGLAMLIIDGPLRGMPEAQLNGIGQRLVAMVEKGL